MMTYIFYVWICVIVMSVVTVYAGTVKRPVSDPITQWVYIPKSAKANETWIPIPHHVLENSSLTKHFDLIRMYVNGILTNETLYPTHEGEPNSVPAIIYSCFLLLLLICGWLIALFKLMQKQQRLPSS